MGLCLDLCSMDAGIVVILTHVDTNKIERGIECNTQEIIIG